MTLEQLANLGEFLSGIAVIASLIYLAVQIRHNTKTVKSSTLISNTDIWSNMLLTISDRGNIGAFTYGYFPLTEIDPAKFTQFQLQCRALFVGFENQYYQYRNQMIDAETYEGYTRSMCNMILSMPGFRVYWEISRDDFSPDFKEHIDTLIENTPVSGGQEITQTWLAHLEKYS